MWEASLAPGPGCGTCTSPSLSAPTCSTTSTPSSSDDQSNEFQQCLRQCTRQSCATDGAQCVLSRLCFASCFGRIDDHKCICVHTDLATALRQMIILVRQFVGMRQPQCMGLVCVPWFSFPYSINQLRGNDIDDSPTFFLSASTHLSPNHPFVPSAHILHLTARPH